MPTQQIGLTELTQAGADKYLGINDAVGKLDAIATGMGNITLTNTALATPVAANVSQRFLIGSSPAGILAGNAGKVLTYYKDVAGVIQPVIYSVPDGSIIGNYRKTGATWSVLGDLGTVSGTSLNLSTNSIEGANYFTAPTLVASQPVTVSSGLIYVRGTGGASTQNLTNVRGLVVVFRRGTDYFLDV